MAAKRDFLPMVLLVPSPFPDDRTRPVPHATLTEIDFAVIYRIEIA